MFGNIGIVGLLVILFTILLLWGPSKLPEFGKAVGKTLRAFRQSLHEKSDDDRAQK